MSKDKLFESTLLIEDDQAHAMLIKRALRDFVEEVLHVEDIQQAFSFLANNNSDLIITDLNLPDTYGTNHVLRLRDKKPHIPIIVLTSSTVIDDAVSAMKLGARDFIVKNFDRNFTNILGLSLSRVSTSMLLEQEKLKLQREMEILRQAIGDAQDGVAIYDRSGDLIYANPTFREFTAQIGSSVEKLECIVSPRISRYAAVLQSIRQNCETLSRGGFWNTEITLSDDQDLAFDLSLSVIGPESQQGIEFVVWVHDIKEQKRRDRFQKDLLSTTTHDLKGPLGAITLSTDILVDMLKDQDKARQLALRIASSAQGASNLIDVFLGARQIQEGAFVLKPKQFDLVGLVRECLAGVEVLGKPKELKLEVDVVSVEKEVTADRLALARVINNLLSNAIKFTPKGGRITVRVWASESEWSLQVSDTGTGLEPAEVQKLFKRFSRLERHGEIEGSGMGLFIVKNIVSAHAGKVEVTSTLGQGTTFQITVPFNPPVNDRGEIICLDFV